MITIRPLEAGDYNAAAALYEQVHQLHVHNRPDLYRGTYALTQAEFDEMRLGEGQLGLAAEMDGQVVGLCAATLKETAASPILVHNRIAYVDVISVAETCRRQGIAHKLWQALLEQAKGKGAGRVELKVWQFNEAALGFYRSVGMRIKYTALEMDV